MSDEPAGFLTRWSRRKEAARLREVAGGEDAPAPPAEQPVAPAAPPPPEETEEQATRRLGLPDIDSLDAHSDYSIFMRDGVPESLQRKALRKLWLSDPVLANLDGLDMYHEDYTDAATVVPDLKTLYRVGRGYLIDEDAAPSAAAPEKADDPTVAETAPVDTGAAKMEQPEAPVDEAKKA
jgi:hypothetical protein